METFFCFLVLSLWINLQFVFSPSHNLWNASRLFCYSCVLLRRDLQPTSYLVFPSFSHLFISNSVQIFIDILYTDAIETKRNKKAILCHCVDFFHPGKFGFMECIFQCSTSLEVNRLYSHYVLKPITTSFNTVSSPDVSKLFIYGIYMLV